MTSWQLFRLFCLVLSIVFVAEPARMSRADTPASGASGGAFFPVHTFDQRVIDCKDLAIINKSNPNRVISGDFKVQWYSKHLSAMSELPLAVFPEDSVVYRFTWLRTFSSPMAFRVQLNSDFTGDLAIKKTNGQGGYDAGHIVVDRTILLSAENMMELLGGFERVNFWTMPQLNCHFGLDGAEWILEAKVRGRYHVVSRHSPQEGAFFEWCLRLMKLSGEELGEIY
jgi:hypothetical protein